MMRSNLCWLHASAWVTCKHVACVHVACVSELEFTNGGDLA